MIFYKWTMVAIVVAMLFALVGAAGALLLGFLDVAMQFVAVGVSLYVLLGVAFIVFMVIELARDRKRERDA